MNYFKRILEIKYLKTINKTADLDFLESKVFASFQSQLQD